jgi:hypothetical protein
MSSWGCDQKVCASCRYWCGRREIDFMANFFDVKEERGVCSGPPGSFRGAAMYEGASCSEWETFRINK